MEYGYGVPDLVIGRDWLSINRRLGREEMCMQMTGFAMLLSGLIN